VPIVQADSARIKKSQQKTDGVGAEAGQHDGHGRGRSTTLEFVKARSESEKKFSK